MLVVRVCGDSTEPQPQESETKVKVKLKVLEPHNISTYEHVILRLNEVKQLCSS